MSFSGPAAPALVHLAGLIERRAVSPAQATMLARQLGSEHARGPVTSLCARLPALAYEAAGGAGALPVQAAAGCVAIYLGADLLDEVADRELPPEWRTLGADQATLASFCLLLPLAVAAFREVDAPPAVHLAVIDALVPALVEMAEGQALDLAAEGRADISRDECVEIVRRKSSQLGLYAQLGALVAGASHETALVLETIGREIGCYLQLLSDCAEVLAPPDDAGDLRVGKRTLPLAHALAKLTGERHAQLVADLAATSEAQRARVRQAVLDAGSVAYVALVAETHRQRALTALRRLPSQHTEGMAALLAEIARR
jgi:geranylgeranyl pyrophosphate synthase